jgi:peptidoglycan/LPS O-acetylase OafA/YrhL
VLLIMVLLGNPLLKRVFSKSWAVWLGLLSFPIYLLHGPIMLSAGAASFVTAHGTLGVAGSAIIAALVSILLTLICAVPLVWVDKAWTRMLGRAASLLLKRPVRSQPRPQSASAPKTPSVTLRFSGSK